MFDEPGIMAWAQAKHDLLLPWVSPPPLMQMQSGLYTDKARAIVREELGRRNVANSDTRGCRKMKGDKYVIYLGYAGLPEDTE